MASARPSSVPNPKTPAAQDDALEVVEVEPRQAAATVSTASTAAPAVGVPPPVTSEIEDDRPEMPSHRIRSAVIQRPRNAAWATLLSYCRLQGGRWWEWVAIWVLKNVRYCPVYVFPLLTGYLIDRIDHHDPSKVTAALPFVLSVTGALCVGTVVCEIGGRFLVSRIMRHLTATLRTALLQRINRLEFDFHDRSQAGALQSKFTLDMGRLEGFQTFLTEPVLLYGTVVLVMTVIIACTNLVLVMVIVVAVPLHLLLARIFWNRISSLNDAYRGAETTFMAKLHEALHGLRAVRAHATEDFIEERLSRSAKDVAKTAMRLDMVSNLFGSGSWALSTLLNMGVVVLGVYMAAGDGHRFNLFGHVFTVPPITIGEFTILMSYYGIMAGAISAILGGLPAVAAADDAVRSLAELYEESTEPVHTGRTPITSFTGDVRLEDVSFSYPGARRQCLTGFNLHLPAGGSLALVGPSGSGKSTVASLILGFYRPTSGRVLIDGRDLTTIERRSMRRNVGVVSQEVVLFQDSILANITWGHRAPDEARARIAAVRANAMEFIEKLPNGFQHVLGDRGGGLSGGQRQRLAIARALYRDPRLLILDEATSALDPSSERLVQEALDELRRDRTTLIIAHRLSTVRKADRIAVIEDGRVVETGTFDELMAANGPFSRLAAGHLMA